MPRRIVNSALANRIYSANIVKGGRMSEKGREDVTDDVIYAIAHLMKTNYELKGKSRLIIHGVGEIKFTPYDQIAPEILEESGRGEDGQKKQAQENSQTD